MMMMMMMMTIIIIIIETNVNVAQIEGIQIDIFANTKIRMQIHGLGRTCCVPSNVGWLLAHVRPSTIHVRNVQLDQNQQQTQIPVYTNTWFLQFG